MPSVGGWHVHVADGGSLPVSVACQAGVVAVRGGGCVGASLRCGCGPGPSVCGLGSDSCALAALVWSVSASCLFPSAHRLPVSNARAAMRAVVMCCLVLMAVSPGCGMGWVCGPPLFFDLSCVV